MSKYRGPRCRRARRVGSDLFLMSGIRAIDTKCKLETPPGMHGAKRTRLSDYGRNLLEKQHICWTYGVSESTLRRYYQKASSKKGKGYNLLRLLEGRLDNVVYRMGFAATRAEARQLVNHRSIWVNSKVDNIPSRQLKPGDRIGVRDKAKSQTRIQAALELAKQRPDVNWVKRDDERLEGVFNTFPERTELSAEYQENKVVEFYS